MKRSRIDAYIMEREALPEVTRESLDALKLRKLNALLKREKERGGFYKTLPDHLDSLEELQTLPGVGPATAASIIEYREGGGTFSKPEDIKNVSGIGDGKYAKLADKICV